MRSRSLAAQHDAVVARRLELLSAELAGTRPWEPRPPARAPLQAVDPDPAERDRGSPLPAVACLPGRHASRRTRSPTDAWTALVPATLRGRIALGPAQTAVVAVTAALGLAITCWWLLHSGGDAVAVPTAVVTPAAGLVTPSSAGAAGTSGAPPATKVVVDVSGKVRRPGIAVLRQGARVIDALRAAGGARRGVDLAGLNLARVLTDGEQVVVGSAAAAAAPASASVSGAPTGLVDLNTADQGTLESLPEIGPVTAQAIIAWRTGHGGFTAVDQLLDVDGIGDATLAKLTPYVTI